MGESLSQAGTRCLGACLGSFPQSRVETWGTVLSRAQVLTAAISEASISASSVSREFGDRLLISRMAYVRPSADEGVAL